jgi:hypothetical protein
VVDRPPILSFVRRALPRPTNVFDTYWHFAAKRQAIYHARVRDEPPPWTTDPILSSHRFTNAYRAADRVSQFLIRRVLYPSVYDVRDIVFRVLLFKLFNKCETWALLEGVIGELIPSRFSTDSFACVLNEALAAGAKIYSAAYIMPPGPTTTHQARKHHTHLQLLSLLLRERLSEKLAVAPSMSEAYKVLRAVPSLGPFLAYQFATDLNYSEHFEFSEMEFVVPGPGARDGLRKCFSSLGDYSEAEVIRWCAERQEEEFQARAITFQSLWGRPLQLIDCQNLFCEVDKYARVAHPEAAGYSGRVRMKRKFVPAGALARPWFPPKWGINEIVDTDLGRDSGADRVGDGAMAAATSLMPRQTSLDL